MQLYIAISEQPDEEDSPVAVLGAFSSEEKAQKACQEDADRLAGLLPPGYEDPVVLIWADRRADTPEGTIYIVLPVTLDELIYA